MLVGKKDDEATGEVPLFYHLDKSVVLQEARAFNESPINPRKCRLILTKIAYLLYQGEVFGTKEATECFFAITKLFQNQDVPLRQMVYLVIKELSTIAEDVIIVTSSLTKDINAKTDVVYRPNAIRALCKITDSSMLPAIERFLKQAIVDKDPNVSSAALVSSLHLFAANKDFVKRWSNEVQESINSKGVMTTYHALMLAYLIKSHDRMSVIKLIRTHSKTQGMRGQYGSVLLIRFTVKMIEDGEDSRDLYPILEGYLRLKNDMVLFEAAKAICELAPANAVLSFSAIAALQLMLVNQKATLRFAAVRVLNRLAMTNPQMVATCNLDLENLISDQNRSVATLAITTLLKTGNEASVDRLMKQINGFMSDISDEFKIIIVEAIRSLCLKFPAKQSLMLTFLSNTLRDEGGYEYKRTIVEAIFDIIKVVPESKEYALSHLCEFIEDCEFTKLAVKILHLLGVEGPKAATPSKYIRFIYNRVILENATVRAAAVSSLARFAVTLPELRGRIRTLLTRCLDDMDDEVRDRAGMYLGILENHDLGLKYIANDTTLSWASLEHSLLTYLGDPTKYSEPFDISATPVVTKAQEQNDKLRAKALAAEQTASPVSAAPSAAAAAAAASSAAIRSGLPPPGSDLATMYASQMERIPQLAALGTIFKSSEIMELTESETEYVIKCVKHVVGDALVFQFNCTNTLPDTQLEKVYVAMTIESTEDDNAALLRPDCLLPVDVLPYNETKTVYVVYRRPSPTVTVTANFGCTLKFLSKEIDPSTGEAEEEGYQDEYLLEDVEVLLGDYMAPLYVPAWERAWEAAAPPAGPEARETYSLSAMPSVKATAAMLLRALGMDPADGTGTVKADALAHTLYLGGTFVGGVPCLGRCRMVVQTGGGVAVEVVVRCPDVGVGDQLANCIV